MRTTGDDPLRLVLGEALDVALREDLEEVLVACPAGRVTAAALFFAEDCELHVGSFEDFGKGGRDALIARVER